MTAMINGEMNYGTFSLNMKSICHKNQVRILKIMNNGAVFGRVAHPVQLNIFSHEPVDMSTLITWAIFSCCRQELMQSLGKNPRQIKLMHTEQQVL